MPGELFQMLSQPHFALQVDVENKDSFIIQPIIMKEGSELIIKYDGDLVTGMDKASENAIRQLNTLIQKTAL